MQICSKFRIRWMCELNTVLHCVPMIPVSEMLHISGQRPYVNTMQDQLLKLEYEKWHPAVCLLSNVP